MLLQSWIVLFIAAVQSVKYKNQTCFKGVGCFYMGEPWTSKLRPLKPPRHPKKYSQNLQAILFVNPHGNDTHRFNLYPEVDLANIPFNPKLNYTVVIVPGYIQPLEGGWQYQLKDAFLNHQDCNVVIINTTAIVQYDIYQVGSDIRVVSVMISNMLEKFHEKGASYKSFHLIGMNFAAQLVGYVGKVKKVGRITGLDPQQILFEGYPPAVRIDKGDADFVDIIHSDARSIIPEIGIGMIEPVGHVDIYLNSGHSQPGCQLPGLVTVHKNQTIYSFVREFTKFWVQAIVCNHVRSVKVFAEAITHPDCILVAYKATNENFFLGLSNAEIEGVLNKFTTITKNCTAKTCTAIGLHTPLFPFRGPAIATTSSKSPFCLDDAPNEKLKRQHRVNVARWYNGVVGNNKE